MTISKGPDASSFAHASRYGTRSAGRRRRQDIERAHLVLARQRHQPRQTTQQRERMQHPLPLPAPRRTPERKAHLHVVEDLELGLRKRRANDVADELRPSSAVVGPHPHARVHLEPTAQLPRAASSEPRGLPRRRQPPPVVEPRLGVSSRYPQRPSHPDSRVSTSSSSRGPSCPGAPAPHTARRPAEPRPLRASEWAFEARAPTP